MPKDRLSLTLCRPGVDGGVFTIFAMRRPLVVMLLDFQGRPLNVMLLRCRTLNVLLRWV